MPHTLKLLAVLLLGFSCVAFADESVVEYECRWTSSEIKIDGKLDDDAWVSAEEIGQFYGFTADGPVPAVRMGTRVRVLWDREYFYFFAELQDDDLQANIREHDGRVWDDDVLSMFFKPSRNHPGYFEFQFNPHNTQLDMFIPQRKKGFYERYKAAQPFHIEAAVELRGTLNQGQDRDQGWVVEGRIPWRDFIRAGGRPAAGETWDFAICRYDYRGKSSRPELSSCAPLREPNFHRYEDYARLRFSRPEPSKIAWTSSRVRGTPEPPRPFRPRRIYPNLKLNFPVCVRYVPGTDQMLLIESDKYNGSPRLVQLDNRPDVDSYRELIDYKLSSELAYDIEFHPNFKENGFVYIGSNLPAEDEKNETRVTRYTMQTSPPYRFDVGSAEVIIRWPSHGHDGAAIVFGHDGMMYVTSGDGTSDSDEDLVGQRLDLLRCKVLRIDVDHVEEGQAYSVPSDNPFVDTPGARPETWAYGFRNPWRMAVDAKTGQLWVGNNGQDLWEQIYLVERGANYGWSVYEGSHPFYPDRERGPTPIRGPTLEHHHAEARSLTGGQVYYGKEFPELFGAYIYGDLATGRIWAARHDGERLLWHREIADTSLSVSYFAIDPQGELVIADHQGPNQGGLYKLERNPVDDVSQDFPKKLSETGIFQSVVGLEPQPGLIGYAVNLPGWHDGATAERYVGFPKTTMESIESGPKQPTGNSSVSFSHKRPWDFPEGTVFVQTLSFPLDRTNPDLVRRIETRLLTKQQGEWAGYSYLWNDEQTDAELVEQRGTKKVISVSDGGSTQQQTWHVPSRSQCMSCHARQAGFVLGFSLFQLNRDEIGEHQSKNQLEVLDDQGVFSVDWYKEARDQWRDEIFAGIPVGTDDPEAERLRNEANQQWSSFTNYHGQRMPPDTSLLYQRADKYLCLPQFDDPSASLRDRARAYLHVNCACCHDSSGGGNARMELRFNIIDEYAKIIDVPPLQGNFGLRDARLVAPGAPHRSVMNYRMSVLSGGRMPRVGSYQMDLEGLRLIRSWIASLADDPTSAATRDMLTRLSDLKQGDEETADQLITQLLVATDGALALIEALDNGRLPSWISERAIDLGKNHSEPSIGSLFERFIPESQRVARLGTHIDPARILPLDGDANRGRKLFFEHEGLACLNCHRVQERGHAVGPDLTETGKKQGRGEILESLLTPSGKIDEKFASYRVVTDDGRDHIGILVKRNEEHVVLMQASGKVVTLVSEDIEDIVRQPRSLMPDDMLRDLTAQQAADLLEFLKSL